MKINELNINSVRDLIDKADTAYYRPGMSQILEDADYDALKLRLRDLDSSDERLTRVGAQYDVSEIGNKTTHNIPMGSLDNTDDGILGFSPWLNSLGDKLGTSSLGILASLKVDGGSICATYENGKLVKVATRGNGVEGEDVTVNGAAFRGLPTTLSKPINADVRGEAVLYKQDFVAICDRDGIAEADRSNPRNLGNGILGRHDGKDSDKIRFLAFNLVTDTEFTTEIEKFNAMKELGFVVVPHRFCGTQDELHNFYTSVVDGRDRFPFEIDGLVVVLNIIQFQDKFVTSDPKTRLRPKYARAIKFPHKFNTTTLLGVNVTVGHTRMIIPTAILQEVRIGGVNVSNALLNNYEEIKRLDIAIGDDVEVILAGDIIPKITRRVKLGENRQPILEPAQCPSCNENTTRSLRGKDGACTFCSNPKCFAAVFAKLSCWIGTSKKGVGILDIGDNMIKALWDNKMLVDPADLYTLTVDGIRNVAIGKGVRIGLSRAEKIIKNINNKRHLSISTFLGSLGIDLLGRRRVIILQESAGGQLDSLDDWLDLEKLRTIQLPGFGSAIRSAIVQGIEENKPLIEKLLANGVVVADSISPINDNHVVNDSTRPFSGLTFCLTGTRDHLDDIVRLGGIIKSGVSKGLSYLVQKDPTSASNKTKKAEEYGTQIISIAYLKQAIDGEVILNQPELVS